MKLAKPRLQVIKNQIIDILDQYGPIEQSDITKKLAHKRGVARHVAGSSLRITTKYKSLIADTNKVLDELEQERTATWSQAGWKLT